ncbi:tyrosine-type recombinase/integrase [Bacillus alkalicellulosilyticus]|uniref:tyrosine-type recombinase/integrase n=1 Tax=Alkalihalobacterium alkalicellulosilyticum TaxID=1912214 RepID=UPI000996B38D|nr:tyrosine-type recombinase/integrase [Bacillus alkalicellulosilyticus]
MEHNDNGVIYTRVKPISLIEKDEINKTHRYALINRMLNEEYYIKMKDILDENNYLIFNDLEMIYYYVHKEKDMDKRKNRMENTKREYFRELLWFYSQMLENHERFGVKNERRNINNLLKSLERKNIRKFQEWLKVVPNGKGGKPYSVSTIARKIVIIKSFIQFLFQCQYLNEPIHETFLSSNIHRRDRANKDLNSVEVIQLMEYFKGHPIVYALILVLATTGCRIREICNARICDLSYDKGEYWLKVIGKGNEEREVLIHPPVFNSIVAFRRRRGLDTVIADNDESYIFTTAKQKPYTFKYLSNYLTKVINNTDLPVVKHRTSPIGPHHFRHAFAITSAELGVDIYRIMQTLGHKKIETTMIYLERHLARKNNAAHKWKNSDIINSI